MNVRNFFQRNQKTDLVCDTHELEKKIVEWIEFAGWKFEDFVKFLKLVGVQPPIKASNFDEKTSSFHCSTRNAEFDITLIVGDPIALDSEIWITETVNRAVTRRETNRYSIEDYDVEVNNPPTMTLYSKDIIESEKELTCFYTDPFRLSLKVDNTHNLRVEISTRDEDFYISFWKHNQEIENHLLNLCHPVTASFLYCALMNLLTDPDGNRFHYEKFSISYSELGNILDEMVVLSDGKIQK